MLERPVQFVHWPSRGPRWQGRATDRIGHPASTAKEDTVMNRAARSLLAVALGSVAILSAAVAQAGEGHHTVVHGDAVKWGAGPPSLPPGAQGAALLGSPAKEGPFVLRLKFPAGFVIPPHRHSKDEFVTVISGGFAVASGERLDRSAQPLRAASFVHLPAGMPHFAFTTEETVVQINGTGPFDVMYLDPNDDPRKK
jgi:quercetin dioxygenase-like cupin family protein